MDSEKSDAHSDEEAVKCYRCGGNGIAVDAAGYRDCPNCAGKGTVGTGDWLVIETHSGLKRHLTTSVVINLLLLLPDKGFLTRCGKRIHLAEVRSATAP